MVSDPRVKLFLPRLPDRSREAKRDLVSALEVDTNLGADPLRSAQQAGKEETGNFCWSPAVHPPAPDHLITAKPPSPPLARSTTHTINVTDSRNTEVYIDNSKELYLLWIDHVRSIPDPLRRVSISVDTDITASLTDITAGCGFKV